MNVFLYYRWFKIYEKKFIQLLILTFEYANELWFRKTFVFYLKSPSAIILLKLFSK